MLFKEWNGVELEQVFICEKMKICWPISVADTATNQKQAVNWWTHHLHHHEKACLFLIISFQYSRNLHEKILFTKKPSKILSWRTRHGYILNTFLYYRLISIIFNKCRIQNFLHLSHVEWLSKYEEKIISTQTKIL